MLLGSAFLSAATAEAAHQISRGARKSPEFLTDSSVQSQQRTALKLLIQPQGRD